MKRMFGALTLALAAPAAAQAAEPLFAANEPIHIRIQAPLSNLARNRNSPGSIA